MIKIAPIFLSLFLFVTEPISAENIETKNNLKSQGVATDSVRKFEKSVIYDNIMSRLPTGRELPIGYRAEPPGYTLNPPGSRNEPSGFLPTPRGYYEKEPNRLEIVRGYSENPPNFIEKEKHPQANNEDSLKIDADKHPEANLSLSLRISNEDHPKANKDPKLRISRDGE